MYIKNPPYVDKNRDEVRATPFENIVAAKELLEHNKSPAALETAVKLMTKALVQQEKAMSSRWLESDPALCRSSTASKARGNGNYGTRPDNESHTGSSEVQRREAHNRVDAVTQHTTTCCSMQVVDITLAEHRSASITSLRVVQQKHSGAEYKHSFIITNQSRDEKEMLP
jgi:hypothetical protein